MATNQQQGISSWPLAGLTAKVTTKKNPQLAYYRRCGVPSLETMQAKNSEIQPQTAIAVDPSAIAATGTRYARNCAARAISTMCFLARSSGCLCTMHQ